MGDTATFNADAAAEATGWELLHLATCASTNDEASARLAHGARFAVVADQQTQGRGREGRRFASPDGGLYLSVLRPPTAPAALPRRVAESALAAATAIESLIDVAVQIKWPNDLWIGGCKVGGILLEARAPDLPVVSGIGVNISAVPDTLPAATHARTTALDAWRARRTDASVRQALLIALLRELDRLEAEPQDVAPRWRARLAMIGCEVTCTYRGAQVHGRLLDVDLERGLHLDSEGWLTAAYVQDLRVP